MLLNIEFRTKPSPPDAAQCRNQDNTFLVYLGLDPREEDVVNIFSIRLIGLTL